MAFRKWLQYNGKIETNKITKSNNLSFTGGKEMKTIKTKQAPQAIGPYSQAKIVNGLLITSGQIPLDPETGKVVGTTIKEQTNQVLKNIQGILTEAGSDFAHVVKTTCYLQNMADFTAFNEVYAEYFSAEYPARTTIEISKLPMDVLVEIEIIAEVVA